MTTDDAHLDGGQAPILFSRDLSHASSLGVEIVVTTLGYWHTIAQWTHADEEVEHEVEHDGQTNRPRPRRNRAKAARDCSASSSPPGGAADVTARPERTIMATKTVAAATPSGMSHTFDRPNGGA